MIRPGPRAIPPGEHPGGVIIHVYDTRGTLLSTSHVRADDDLQADAARAALQSLGLVGRAPVCLVAYDGDTGKRYSALDWLGVM